MCCGYLQGIRGQRGVHAVRGWLFFDCCEYQRLRSAKIENAIPRTLLYNRGCCEGRMHSVSHGLYDERDCNTCAMDDSVCSVCAQGYYSATGGASSRGAGCTVYSAAGYTTATAGTTYSSDATCNLCARGFYPTSVVYSTSVVQAKR